jgi:hypothetical protein
MCVRVVVAAPAYDASGNEAAGAATFCILKASSMSRMQASPQLICSRTVRLMR